jgi:hypothetical protein
MACGHSFCTECLGGMAAVHITDGSLEMLRCPEMDCGDPLELETLRRLVDTEAFERWERLTLQKVRKPPFSEPCLHSTHIILPRQARDKKHQRGQVEKRRGVFLKQTLDAMVDLVYCPRCEDPVLEEGGGDHFGQVRKRNRLRCHFMLKVPSLYQDRLGTDTEKTQEEMRFSCSARVARWRFARSAGRSSIPGCR